MCCQTLKLNASTIKSYYVKFYNDYNLNYDLTSVIYKGSTIYTEMPTNGYIEFAIFKTATKTIVGPSGSNISTTVYCAYPISNSYAGSISNISYASNRSEQMNIYNTPSTKVATYYLPVLQRGSTGSTSTDGTPHNIWTKGNYYVKFNNSTDAITEFHAPSVYAGSTQLTSDERLKDFKNDVEIDFNKLKQIPKKNISLGKKIFIMMVYK